MIPSDLLNPPHMSSDVFDDLVIALLSVNGYGVEKTWSLHAALEQTGLFDLESVSRLEEDEIAKRLQTAGYNRGEFLTNLLAVRLSALARYLRDLGWTEARGLLKSGDASQVREVLGKAHGVGPLVLDNFLWLRGERAG